MNIESKSNAGSKTLRITPLPPTLSFSEFSLRPFSPECSQLLEELKDRVAAELANEFSSLNYRLIRQAVNEADSLAAATPFPTLVLPVLAEEKARQVFAWAAKQQTIRSHPLALAA